MQLWQDDTTLGCRLGGYDSLQMGMMTANIDTKPLNMRASVC